jgi:Polysaccharide deacetylase
MIYKAFILAQLLPLVLAQDRGGVTTTGSSNALNGYQCDTSSCKLPSCKCATSAAPVANPPMFVLVTFDDSIQTGLMPTANSLFTAKNPNGCATKGTWFAQVTDSNPLELQKWYAAGHEVADHSVDHDAVNHVFAGTYAQMEGMRAWASTYGGVPAGKIKGVRFPFRNFTVDSLNILSKMGFLYESSMAAGDSSEHIWPYTLDYGAVTDCLGRVSVCGAQDLKAPGLWEVPMYSTTSASGGHLMDPYNVTVI